MLAMQWFKASSFILILALTACHPAQPYSQVQRVNTNIALTIHYLHRQQYDMAKQYLQASYRIAPHYPLLWDAFAYYEELLGNIRIAEQDYRYAIQLNPHSGAAHNNYGVF